jgi:hypothetical protein
MTRDLLTMIQDNYSIPPPRASATIIGQPGGAINRLGVIWQENLARRVF